MWHVLDIFYHIEPSLGWSRGTRSKELEEVSNNNRQLKQPFIYRRNISCFDIKYMRAIVLNGKRCTNITMKKEFLSVIWVVNFLYNSSDLWESLILRALVSLKSNKLQHTSLLKTLCTPCHCILPKFLLDFNSVSMRN